MNQSRLKNLITFFIIIVTVAIIVTVFFERIFQRNVPFLNLIRREPDRKLLPKYVNFSSSTLQWTMKQGQNLTIVTSFWDIGSFQKGDHRMFSPSMYEEWAKVYGFLLNPLIIFTDSKHFKNLMSELRHDRQGLTKVIYMKKRKLWPFQLLMDIKSVFDQPDYPKYHPNTVLAEYSAIQHAKYAAVGDAIRSNIFESEYYAWLDIGYFRDIVNDKRYFILTPPENHNKSLLAMNEVYHPNLNLTPEEIFKQNVVWVGGGIFIGTRSVQLAFEELYKKAVLHFLGKKLMNSDQQVIYAMYSLEGTRSLKPNVELQLYSMKDDKSVGTRNPWFYLGFLCRHAVEIESQSVH